MNDTRPLATRTAVGAAWLTVQTLANKLIASLGQVALTWFLDPKAFGQATLAFATVAVLTVLQNVGIKEILLSRGRRSRVHEPSAFWLSLLLGAVVFATACLAAPVAARFYGNTSLSHLILVTAAAAPLNGLAIVPQARLELQMRFRLLAGINSFTGLVQVGGAVIMAFLGAGAMSLAVPFLIAAAVRAIAYWRYASTHPLIPLWRPRRWRVFAAGAGWLTMASICAMVVAQGDYMILGAFAGQAEVGRYAIAFSLSTQTIQLLNVNLASVLLPALAVTATDQNRLRLAVVRAVRLINIVGIPMCAMQATVGVLVVQAVFPENWHGSAVLFSILSGGMAFAVTGGVSYSLFRATGRFQMCAVVYLAYAVGFTLAVVVGSATGGATGTAIAAVACLVVFEPAKLYFAARPAAIPFGLLLRLLLVPIAGVILATAVGLPTFVAARLAMPALIAAALASSVGVIIYCAFVRWADPVVAAELVTLVRGVTVRTTLPRVPGSDVGKRT
ncbi:MAG TPA: oligosaccharide flippase family protein [Tepidisphaeraceae bacterium]|nr:oligosaccharide flippase family protein [Tepidisphaeraceae bacterium]